MHKNEVLLRAEKLQKRFDFEWRQFQFGGSDEVAQGTVLAESQTQRLGALLEESGFETLRQVRESRG